MKSLFSVLVLSTLVSAGAVASEPYQMQKEVRLEVDRDWKSEGETTTHRFREPVYVERLLVSAEGRYNYSTIDVYADSDRVAVLGVPGRDPDFPIVIRKKVSSIQFRFNGRAKINDARAWADFGNRYGDPYGDRNGDRYQDDYQTPGYGMDNYRSHDRNYSLRANEDIARAVLSVVAQLQINIFDEDFRTYLLPLRKAAIRLSASAGARPPLADKTQNRAYALKLAIDNAEPLLEKMIGNQVYVRAIELLYEVRERIESNYEG